MSPVVRHRHLTRHDEGDRPSEQADHDQESAHHLEKARPPEDRKQLSRDLDFGGARKSAEELGIAVLEEQETGHDAERRMTPGRHVG
jgi:hypothetical protein